MDFQLLMEAISKSSMAYRVCESTMLWEEYGNSAKKVVEGSQVFDREFGAKLRYKPINLGRIGTSEHLVIDIQEKDQQTIRGSANEHARISDTAVEFKLKEEVT